MKYTTILILLAMAAGQALMTSAQEVVTDDSIEQQQEELQAISRIDTFELKMKVRVPRVYDNTHSLGYRKYQWQTIVGPMKLVWKDGQDTPDVEFGTLTNKTHKLSNKKNINYSVMLDENTMYSRFNAVGSNMKHQFKTAAINFAIIADPVSYAVWEDPDEDNSLLLTLAGAGNIVTKKGITRLNNASGSLAGTLGCGCKEYGHTSPTRVLGENGPICDDIDDVAAAYGTWSMKWKRSDFMK